MRLFNLSLKALFIKLILLAGIGLALPSWASLSFSKHPATLTIVNQTTYSAINLIQAEIPAQTNGIISYGPCSSIFSTPVLRGQPQTLYINNGQCADDLNSYSLGYYVGPYITSIPGWVAPFHLKPGDSYTVVFGREEPDAQ